MTTSPTCTVTVHADGGVCGAPAVTSFTSKRTGRTYHECASHDMSHTVTHSAAAVRAHPPTRTSKPFVLVRSGAIVGYADTHSDAVARRARKLGADVVAVVR